MMENPVVFRTAYLRPFINSSVHHDALIPSVFLGPRTRVSVGHLRGEAIKGLRA